MKLKQCIALVLGLFLLTCISTGSAMAQSGNATVKVSSRKANDLVVVPLNRAVVLESDVSFSELSVANPAIADIATLSDKTIYVLGKSPGTTTLTLLGPDGRLITNVDLNVNPNIADLKRVLREVLPDEKNLEIYSANNSIVLSGVASGSRSLTQAMELARRYSENVINMAVVGGQHQVMLEVKFAEMARSTAKGLRASTSLAGADGAFSTGGFLSDSNPGDDLFETDADTLGAGLFNFAIGGLTGSIALEALENKGLAKTLAEPNLVALSGQEAGFLAGGEYPLPTLGDGGDIAIQYRPFGVELEFKPTVIQGKKINLDLRTSVSAIDESTAISANGVNVFGFSRREASTVVELNDGQSFAIAGLLQDDFSDAVNQVPWLGDVPILGALFRSSSYKRNQTELVIIVTAHLVSPVDGDLLALPTDRVPLPSEGDLFLKGRTTGTSNQIDSSYGYVLE